MKVFSKAALVLLLYFAARTALGQTNQIEGFFNTLDQDKDNQIQHSEIQKYLQSLQPQDSNPDLDATLSISKLDSVDIGKSISRIELENYLSNKLKGNMMLQWLKHGINLPQYEQTFKENGITALDLPVLIEGGEKMLRDELGVSSVLHQRKLLHAMNRMVLGAGTTPSAPQSLTVSAHDRGGATLSWEHPASLGTPPLQKYVIEKRVIPIEQSLTDESPNSAQGYTDWPWSHFEDVDHDKQALLDHHPTPPDSQTQQVQYRIVAWNVMGHSDACVSNKLTLTPPQRPRVATCDSTLPTALYDTHSGMAQHAKHEDLICPDTQQRSLSVLVPRPREQTDTGFRGPPVKAVGEGGVSGATQGHFVGSKGKSSGTKGKVKRKTVWGWGVPVLCFVIQLIVRSQPALSAAILRYLRVIAQHSMALLLSLVAAHSRAPEQPRQQHVTTANGVNHTPGVETSPRVGGQYSAGVGGAGPGNASSHIGEYRGLRSKHSSLLDIPGMAQSDSSGSPGRGVGDQALALSPRSVLRCAEASSSGLAETGRAGSTGRLLQLGGGGAVGEGQGKGKRVVGDEMVAGRSVLSVSSVGGAEERGVEEGVGSEGSGGRGLKQISERSVQSTNDKRCAFDGCPITFSSWYLPPLPPLKQRHYCCRCQLFYCTHHTAYTNHGLYGPCDKVSQCVCVTCFSGFSQAQQYALASKNTVKESDRKEIAALYHEHYGQSPDLRVASRQQAMHTTQQNYSAKLTPSSNPPMGGATAQGGQLHEGVAWQDRDGTVQYSARGEQQGVKGKASGRKLWRLVGSKVRSGSFNKMNRGGGGG